MCFGCDDDRSDDLLVLRHGCQGLVVCIESMYADAIFAVCSESMYADAIWAMLFGQLFGAGHNRY